MDNIDSIMRLVRDGITADTQVKDDGTSTLELTDVVSEEDLKNLVVSNIRPLLEKYLDEHAEDIARAEIRKILQERSQSESL